MIQNIQVNDVIKILKDKIATNISLKSGYYYRSSLDNILTILRRDDPYDGLIDESNNLISFGTPIFQVVKLEIELFPTILDYLIGDFTEVKINDSKIKEVTFGQSITLGLSNGFHLLTDYSNNKIAFGKTENGIFQPYTDIGWYIRSGN